MISPGNEFGCYAGVEVDAVRRPIHRCMKSDLEQHHALVIA